MLAKNIYNYCLGRNGNFLFMKEQKKYCIWDKRVNLCVANQGSFWELKKLCDKLNLTTPNRYELREVK